MINLENYSTNLIEREGIYFSKKESKISYPEDGNDSYFKIEDNSFWFQHRNNFIVEGVLKYSPESLFFDIGGGNGFVSKAIENKGVPTVLVEPGIQGCLNAKKRGLENIVCSTLENGSFKKNTIPSIGLFDVVEHIEDDKDFLKSIYDFLTPDGYVYITVPAFNALWSNEDKDVGHYRRYSLKEITIKLTNVGFTIEYSTYFFSILPIAVFLFRSIPSRLGLNKNSDEINKLKKEHGSEKGLMAKLLKLIWNFEIKKIKDGKKIMIGGSCFVIARKNTDFI